MMQQICSQVDYRHNIVLTEQMKIYKTHHKHGLHLSDVNQLINWKRKKDLYVQVIGDLL